MAGGVVQIRGEHSVEGAMSMRICSLKDSVVYVIIDNYADMVLPLTPLAKYPPAKLGCAISQFHEN